MGPDSASFFAKLFLFYLESKWSKKGKKSNFSRAKRFANVLKFINDLTALDDRGEF